MSQALNDAVRAVAENDTELKHFGMLAEMGLKAAKRKTDLPEELWSAIAEATIRKIVQVLAQGRESGVAVMNDHMFRHMIVESVMLGIGLAINEEIR